MRTFIRTAIPLLFIMCATASAQAVLETSFLSPSGERILQHQAVVAAPIAEVWRTFTTSEGLRSFVAPVARIDFRPGGIWEVSYDPKAKIGQPGNIRNEIVSYLPMKMIALRIVQTPPDFSHPEIAKRLWTVLEFEDLGFNRVRVTGSMLGWKSGPDWDAVYRIFRAGNAETLAALQKRFTDGPRDWSGAPRRQGRSSTFGSK